MTLDKLFRKLKKFEAFKDYKIIFKSCNCLSPANIIIGKDDEKKEIIINSGTYGV